MLWEESESMNQRKQKNCPYNIVCTYVSMEWYRHWESLEDNATKYVQGMCTIRTEGFEESRTMLKPLLCTRPSPAADRGPSLGSF